MKIKYAVIWLMLLAMLFVLPAAYAFKIDKDLAKEIADKKKAVEIKPNDPFSHFDLAISYAYANKIEEGWEELKKTNDKLASGEVVYNSAKDYAVFLIDKFNKKLQQDPKDWRSRFRLAFALYFGDRKDEAIKQIEEIAKQDPKNIWAYGYMGVIYGEQGNYEKAIITVRKGLKIDSEVSSLHYALGQAFYKKGLAFNGFQEISKALQLKAMGK
jgi:tetratricopeptide (TPR) repeat protein